jgi:CRISPR/Cas system-associated exonuclease Cas4 (RecB family)
MAAMPERQHSTATRVEEWRGRQPQEHRAHLGASVLGHDCSRHLWYLFRNARTPTFTGKLLRVFDRGKREEPVVFEELRAIGVELHTDDNGKQIECRDSTGHIGGSVDGIGKGFPESPNTWAVLEIKTHSAKSFADLQKQKVQASKPQHWAQMQVYMGLLELERALYYAVNKDTDDIYVEWVHFDAEAFDALINRGRDIVAMSEPPPKLSEDPAHWQCKFCQHHALCHDRRVAETNCRTCVHATPAENGEWHCARHNALLPRHAQLAACEQHLLIPSLIPYAKPIDGGDAYVEYEHLDNGKTFRNGPGGLSSKEISACIDTFVVDPVVEAMRATFGATVKSSRRTTRAKDLSKIPCPEEVPFDDPIPF